MKTMMIGKHLTRVGIVTLVAFSNAPIFCQRLSSPIAQANFTASTPQPFSSGKTPAKWSGAYSVFWADTTTTSDTGENLFVYSRDGQLKAGVRVWFPDAFRVTILDAAASAKGEVAAVGFAYGNSGTVAGFLAIVSNGQIINVVRTTPFDARSVVFSSDETIWTFGPQVGPGGRVLAAPADHATIQRYHSDGIVLDQLMPRTSWCPTTQTVHPALEGHALVAFGDRVGIVSAGCSEWVEFDVSGKMVSRVPSQMPASSSNSKAHRLLFRAVMTDNDSVFAYFADTPKPLYKLNTKTGAWQSVDVAVPGTPFLGLLGGDGPSLVYKGGPANVFWATVVK